MSGADPTDVEDGPPQVGLFGGEVAPPAPRRRRRPRTVVGPAEVPDALRASAARLPASVRFGTSSWSFPGWKGLVYDEAHTERHLAQHGLAAYARHPLMRTVGVDRSHYQPLSAEQWAVYREQVPADFSFLVKGHEACTLARFPDHPRYGRRRGQPNPDYLDPVYATERVVGPTVEGLGDKLGPLLFQVAPQPLEQLGGAHAFAERLHRFLDGLPKGPTYAVELRNTGLLTSTYAQALHATGASHGLSAHGSMPDLRTQWRLAGLNGQGPVVVRWMLRRALDYQAARNRYRPFSALVDPDPDTRQTIAAMCAAMVARGRPVWVVVNNKAEGSSPLSVFSLAEVLGRLVQD